MSHNPETMYVQTITPGKKGTYVNREKYERIRDAILRVLATHSEILFKELSSAVKRELDGRFDGSIPWYTTTVKLDLEFRGIIERIPGKAPQHLRLAKAKTKKTA